MENKKKNLEELQAKQKANQEKINQLEIKIKNTDYLSLRAKFQNEKTQIQKDIDTYKAIGQDEVLKELNKLLDIFSETLKYDITEKKFDKGVSKLEKELKKILEEFNIGEVDCTGKLDPTYHYAVMMDNVQDMEDDQIIQVLQKGYKIEDRLIRPAMVKVNKK